MGIKEVQPIMKKKPTDRKRPDVPRFDESPVASATECTGLMPALPEGAQSQANLANLYSVHREKRQ